MSDESLFRTVDSRYGRMTYFANDIGAVSQSLENYGEWAENELAFVAARHFKEASSINFRRSMKYGPATLCRLALYLLHRARLSRWKGLTPRIPAAETAPKP